MAIQEQERLCQRIVDDNPDAIIYADREGTIRPWNAGAEAMFGYRADEGLGQSLDLIIPEKLRGRHWEGYRTVMATGVTRYGRELLKVPALPKDGTRISLEFSIVLLRAAAGQPVGAAATVRREIWAHWAKRAHSPRGERERGGGTPLSVGPAGRAGRLRSSLQAPAPSPRTKRCGRIVNPNSATLSILRDVTERWQQEKAIQERLAALEAKTS